MITPDTEPRAEKPERFDPIEYYDQGGSGLGQMKPCPDGDWIRYEDVERISAQLDQAREQITRLTTERDDLRLRVIEAEADRNKALGIPTEHNLTPFSSVAAERDAAQAKLRTIYDEVTDLGRRKYSHSFRLWLVGIIGERP